MQPERSHSGDLSQDSKSGPAHQTGVPGRKPAPPIDRAARNGKRFYNALSASSVGLELGISVVIGVVFGLWLDGRLGTEPWMMLLFLGIGLVAGFRGVLRAVSRSDRAAKAEEAEASHG